MLSTSIQDGFHAVIQFLGLLMLVVHGTKALCIGIIKGLDQVVSAWRRRRAFRKTPRDDGKHRKPPKKPPPGITLGKCPRNPLRSKKARGRAKNKAIQGIPPSRKGVAA
jgi:hypothetical protein